MYVFSGGMNLKLTWNACFKVGLSVFVLYLCIHYWAGAAGLLGTMAGAALPLILGAMIAYVVGILMGFYERHYFPKSEKPVVEKSRRIVCMLAAFVTLIAIVALVIGLVVPQLVSAFQVILAAVPEAINRLLAFLEEQGLMTQDIAGIFENVDIKSKLWSIVETLTTGLGSAVTTVVSVVSSVFSGIVTGLLSLIFSIYLLLGKDNLKRQSHRLLEHYLPEKVWHKTFYVLGVLNDSFRRYIVGQCTEAVILGVLCTLGMLLLGLPYATMIGALVAFTALIPVAGAYIGAGVGAFMILMVSPMKAVIFLIFILILQQLEGNLIYPRVVGSSLGLPGIWVLAAVTVGGGVLGIGGMLLGVPLTAALYRILREDMNKDIPGDETETEEQEPET